MSAPGTSIFDNISRAPKSPKSNKPMSGASGLENPLLKAGQFSFGGGGASSSFTQSSSKTMQRSPLMNMNNSNHEPQNQRLQQPQQQSILKNSSRKLSQLATPGPPPRMSLSLMGRMTLPMEMNNNRNTATPKSYTKRNVQNSETPTMAGVSTPVPVASPPFLLKNKGTTNNNNNSSESLVADHWVVAHGYTSPIEYKELLNILSTFGRIQRQEANGNWLAVQFESRLSAEKAICCQPILLTNSLCGIARGTPDLLQRLNTGKQQQIAAKGSAAKSMEQLQNDTNKTVTTITGKLGKLDENDILLLENSSYADDPRKPYEQRSICDKMLSWYFGWDEHSHSD